MFPDKDREQFIQLVRPMQIIVVALVMGVLTFLVVVLVMGLDLQSAAPPLISYLALGFAGVAVLALLIVPGLVVGHGRRAIVNGTFRASGLAKPTDSANTSDTMLLAGVFQSQLIVACAFLEGAAFFNVMAYMLHGLIANLIVAVALAGAILCHFPTAGSLQDWVTREEGSIKQLRG